MYRSESKTNKFCWGIKKMKKNTCDDMVDHLFKYFGNNVEIFQ